MGQVLILHVDDRPRFAEMRAVFERNHSDLRLSLVQIDGDCVLRSAHGGMRVFWIYRGHGEALLPRGYRTQEGDGCRLPDEYRPDPLDPALAETLQRLKAGLPMVSSAAAVPVQAILSRWTDAGFVGDFAGELWRLDHLARPWSSDERVEAAIGSLFRLCRQSGCSTKQLDSYEPVLAGDQLIASGGEEIHVRGQFDCLALENVRRPTSHVSAARRLRYLADTAGGCNPDFDPFRRLPLTWFYNYPGESDDGLNWVNSHVVNIPKESSPSHFHPSRPIGSGSTQSELYLVLDPQAYQLNTYGRAASLIVWPDLRDLTRYEQHPLQPGSFVYMPPGTGHRGLDVFVNVLTLPGFKPHNEYYIDRDIRDTTGGQTPYNENLLDLKNYSRIEDLL
ncbi:MAG: cupin domain-containing protein [Candidatus Anammoximicrobium sp.]|nr:cupin domain-containing protein [Candidatus Anammoximicrobium sp.]